MNDEMKSYNNNCIPFTFDFDSLYDSLSPNLVLRALKDSISECREEWSDDFCEWLCDIVNLSMNASIGEFNGKYYKQKKGIATGGSNCVELANITVYHVLKSVIYDRPEMMSKIIGVKRFIDDGCGIHRMSSECFKKFMIDVNSGVAMYGLKIKESDWSVPENSLNPVHFLDMNIFIDRNEITTTLYRKPTDSRRYLNFMSCHPNHVFSGVVYSQGLRLRRIIKCDDDLRNELSSLKEDFLKSFYPEKMIDNIFEKVYKLNRIELLKNKRQDDFSEQTNDKIMAITTFGRDKPIIEVTKKLERKFPSINFQKVNKTALALKSILDKTKNISLGPQRGLTMKCDRSRCKSCALMSEKNTIICSNTKRKHFTAFGSCLSKNIIYNAECKHCGKMYVGKTTQRLCDRISGHRSFFMTAYQMMV